MTEPTPAFDQLLKNLDQALIADRHRLRRQLHELRKQAHREWNLAHLCARLDYNQYWQGRPPPPPAAAPG